MNLNNLNFQTISDSPLSPLSPRTILCEPNIGEKSYYAANDFTINNLQVPINEIPRDYTNTAAREIYELQKLLVLELNELHSNNQFIPVKRLYYNLDLLAYIQEKIKVLLYHKNELDYLYPPINKQVCNTASFDTNKEIVTKSVRNELNSKLPSLKFILNSKKETNTIQKSPKKKSHNSSRVEKSEKRFCRQCKHTETPEWRRGPYGLKTLCNACGLYYNKMIKRFGIPKANIIMRYNRKNSNMNRRLQKSVEIPKLFICALQSDKTLDSMFYTI